jgi:hypothetical protein
MTLLLESALPGQAAGASQPAPSHIGLASVHAVFGNVGVSLLSAKTVLGATTDTPAEEVFSVLSPTTRAPVNAASTLPWGYAHKQCRGSGILSH